MEESQQRPGLMFFGKVSASVTHELKNVFAIVSETSGLMEDLSEMAEENGRPLDMERQRTLLRRIREQVKRGNTIIRNYNRFAHSVDDPKVEYDPAEMVELLIALCTRLADMRRVRLSSEVLEDVRVTGDPFALLNLLFLFFQAGLGAMEEGEEIRFFTGSGQDGAVVRMRGFSLERFPAESAAVAGSSGARVASAQNGVDVLVGSFTGTRSAPAPS